VIDSGLTSLIVRIDAGLLNRARSTGGRGRPGDATRTGAAPISRNLNDAAASLAGLGSDQDLRENRVVIDEAGDAAAPIAAFGPAETTAAAERRAQAPST
jgi:hypothetical protein